ARTTRNSSVYEDNRFLKMKLNWFLQIESFTELILWGAGKKGKELAKMLVEKEIPFMWLTENQKKAGKDIYGVRLRSDLDAIDGASVIVALGNQNDQEHAGLIGQQKGWKLFYFS
ncbi:MAG: hypothetical protein AAF193_10865, partial [Bacteroidota bacterium]